jgi:flagellar hook protein FlgE
MAISFEAPLSGIKAAITRENVAAHNVANVQTPGFAQYNVMQTDVVPTGTMVTGLSQTPNPNPATSNTDLAQTTVEQIISKDSLTANAAVVKVQDKMLGELLDLVG